MADGPDPLDTHGKKHQYRLAQFTINTQTEEFAVCGAAWSISYFSKLEYLENSRKYFLAQKTAFNKTQEICLLSISKNHVEILRVISRPSRFILDQLGSYTVLRGGTVLEVNTDKIISVYGLSRIKKKFEGTDSEESEDEW